MYRHSLVCGKVELKFAVSHGRNPLRRRDASVTVYVNGVEVKYSEGTWEGVKEWSSVLLAGIKIAHLEV